MDAITLFGRVFTQRQVGDLTLLHEAEHVRQQERDGWKFYFRYLFSRKWRAAYEAEGYAVQVKDNPNNLDWAARALSGSLYLWPCSFEEAKRLILIAVENKNFF